MNAEAALYLSDMAKTYANGVAMAKGALAAGKAYEKLQ
jgi:anthranilate phosphoribosyltransferase